METLTKKCDDKLDSGREPTATVTSVPECPFSGRLAGFQEKVQNTNGLVKARPKFLGSRSFA